MGMKEARVDSEILRGITHILKQPKNGRLLEDLKHGINEIPVPALRGMMEDWYKRVLQSIDLLGVKCTECGDTGMVYADPAIGDVLIPQIPCPKCSKGRN